MNIKITRFGDSLLRHKTKDLSVDEIKSSKVQNLIVGMRFMLNDKKLGIGLAAPQIGQSISIAVIELQKTPLRENLEELSLVIINPKITEVSVRKYAVWEGCISSGQGRAGLFAKVPRHKKISLNYLDENGIEHNQAFTGLAAHVIQHEVDHLNGILFVDKVKDTSTYMTYSEYKKMQMKEKH